MAPQHLRAVTSAPHSLSQRIARLQAEARGLAQEHVSALFESMLETQRLAAEVAAGGDAYPAGVRDIARRLAEDMEAKAETLRAISARAG